MLIPSDEGLYASVGYSANKSDKPTSSREAVYEISPYDGAIRRRFELSADEAVGQVACVYDNKFLAFEHGEGKLIPLIGSLNTLP